MAVTSTFQVTGMTCEHCVRAVTEEFSALDAVTNVQVDLASGAVTVTSETPLPEEVIRLAVDEAGYELANA